MKAFFNTIAVGATLVAGIVSVFQNAPFFMFVKRISLTFIIFYFIGAALNVLWNAAAVYMPTAFDAAPPDRSDDGPAT